jgi:EAL domain-containing protein (putative c-di-GMP-specific phosphodiesterase class I)/ActR/RegA family two-component response regulator
VPTSTPVPSTIASGGLNEVNGTIVVEDCVWLGYRRRERDTLSDNTAVLEGPGRPLVLVVDDDDHTRRVLKQNLGRLGCDVLLAGGGAEALEHAVRFVPAVIFLDLRMPEMDGFSVLRRLSEHGVRASVVVMSGSNEVDDVIEALRSGAVDYLKKPWKTADLAAVLGRAIAVFEAFDDDLINAEPVVPPAALAASAGSQRRLAISDDHAALLARFTSAAQQMWIAMQPVISWRARSVFAYEALLRTDEPSLRNPLDFLDAAHRLDRTAELAALIREQIAALIVDAPAQVKIFVNLLPSDLLNEGLASGHDALTPFADRIVLEVTERAALDKIGGLAEAVGKLRARGYSIGLDDLGAGYAGLTSFALLEPEVVKIDMSLIRGIHQSPVKQKLFASFAALCRDLKAAVVAEGVEEDAERDCLNTLGGDLYQGYLFARPARGFPPPEF